MPNPGQVGQVADGNSYNKNGTLDSTDGSDGYSNDKCIFLPAVPSFPVDVLPMECQQIIDEHALAFSVPVDIPSIVLLSLAGACIGRKRGVTIKQGYSEYPNLFIVVVARSGTGKSPVTRAIQTPILKYEADWYRKYQEELKEYEESLEVRKSTPKKERAHLGAPPEPPVYKQILIDDSTTEALTNALSQNPRGIMWNRDELSGLIYDLDKYTGKDGGTKARIMSAYDCGPWKVNRLSGNNYIPHACLSIFGTIQDGALTSIFSSKDAATGFLPRFNFIRVEQDAPPLWSDAIVSENSKSVLTRIISTLLNYEFKNGEPLFVGVQKEAKDLFVDWYNRQAMEPWKDCESATYEAVLAKLKGQCLRFCLILHCIEAVCSGRSEQDPIGYGTMAKAVKLGDYLKDHQKSVWQLCFSNGEVKQLKPFEKRIAEAIVNLEHEIKSGILPTRVITEYLNRGAAEQYHVRPEAVGKGCKGLGLTAGHLPDKSGRGPRITPEFVEKIKRTLGNRPNRPTCPNTGNNTTNNRPGTVPEPSEPSGIVKDEVIL